MLDKSEVGDHALTNFDMSRRPSSESLKIRFCCGGLLEVEELASVDDLDREGFSIFNRFG